MIYSRHYWLISVIFWLKEDEALCEKGDSWRAECSGRSRHRLADDLPSRPMTRRIICARQQRKRQRESESCGRVAEAEASQRIRRESRRTRRRTRSRIKNDDSPFRAIPETVRLAFACMFRFSSKLFNSCFACFNTYRLQQSLDQSPRPLICKALGVQPVSGSDR